jgi:hypothetical protein
MRAALTQCAEQPYAWVKQQMREEKHKTSFLSQAIETIGTDPELDHLHKWASLSLFTGGADTVMCTPLTPSHLTDHPRLCLHCSHFSSP